MNLSQRIRDVQHFGEEGGVVPDINMAATSTFLDPEDMEKAFKGELTGRYLYSRHSNPTVNMFSAKIAALENTESALGVASGMSAISATIEQLMIGGQNQNSQNQGSQNKVGQFQIGGEVICSQTVYGGTYALFKNVFPKQGIQVKFVNFNKISEVEAAVSSKTKIIYTETLSNPLLNAAHLGKLSQIAKKNNLKLVVDNTFTPAIVTPTKFGADIVIHSCTKYISGTSDMIAGAICAPKSFINELIDVNTGVVMLKGPTMDSRIAHELYLRLDHLPVRMKEHSKSAMFLAENIEKKGFKVIYPGLKSHPDHELFKEQMNKDYGFGGMLTVDFVDPMKALSVAKKLQDIKFGLYAVSLGFSRTLISCPAVSTSSEVTKEDQEKMKLSPGLLRLSIGLVGDDNEMLSRFLKCI